MPSTLQPIDFRGEDNYFRNAVINTIHVLKQWAKENKKTIRNYYDEDVLNPITPCFCVICNGSNDELRASQNLNRVKYTIHMNVEVWYLHAQVTEETKRNEITYILWEISDWLKKHVTLNGFVPKLGLRIDQVRWQPQVRGSRVLAGGIVVMDVPKLYRADITS